MVDVVQTKVGDMLGRLGVSAEVVDPKLLARVPLQALKNLRVVYAKTLVEENKFAKDIADNRVNIPPFGHNPAPQAALAQNRRTVGRTYHRPRALQHASQPELFTRLFDPRTRRGVKAARLLHTSPPVRSSFERTAGAKVVLDGRNDGAVSLNAKSSGSTAVATSAMTSGGGGGMPQPPSYEQFNALFLAMDAAVLEQAHKVEEANIASGGFGALGGNATGAGGSSIFGSTLSGQTSDSDSGEDDGSSGTSGDSATTGLAGFALGLTGSSFGPGGTPIGTGNPVNQPGTQSSVDLATLSLKRLMDKRDQMYDLYRQVNDKHNQSANTAINNMKA